MVDDERNAIRLACEALSNEFAWSVDHRDYQAVAELFTEEGVLDRGGHVASGRGEILAAMEARPIELTARHVITNFRIESISEREVCATSYVTIYLLPKSDSQLPHKDSLTAAAAFLAENHDLFVSTDTGWRISHRRVVPVVVFDT